METITILELIHQMENEVLKAKLLEALNEPQKLDDLENKLTPFK